MAHESRLDHGVVRSLLALCLWALVVGVASPTLAGPSIAWNPPSVDQTLLLGEHKEIPVSFTAEADLNNVALRVAPKLQPFVTIDPPAVGAVARGQVVNFVISMSAPMSSPPRTSHGNVQARSGDDPGRRLPRPLQITLHIATVPPPVSIGAVTVEPSRLEVDALTTLRVTATLTGDPGRVRLQRVESDGTVKQLADLNDNGKGGDVVAGDGVFSAINKLRERETGRLRLQVVATFKGAGRVVSDVISIPVGVLLAPGVGGTIQGPDGISVTVQPGSIGYEVLIGLAQPSASAFVAPTGNLPLAGTVDLIFQPTLIATLPPPSIPLTISIPAPPGTPEGTEFIVGQQALVDSLEGPEPGLRRQLLGVDTAFAIGGQIVTQGNVLPGILGGGLLAILEATGSGFATGIVSQEFCIFDLFCSTVPRPGVVVSNSTNPLVSISDGIGRYTLFISGGPFTVTGFDPFRGASGSATGNITVSGSTVPAHITLNPLAAPAITRDGIRNGGFELCNLKGSWVSTGAARVVVGAGPTSTGVTIRPTEGRCMVDIDTGAGSVGGVGSGLKQQFKVPQGVRTLSVDFNFISEEFPEFVGTIFNDVFRALITTPNGQTQFAQVSVNEPGGVVTPIGDCFIPGGDETCGQTGWRTGSIDLSAFSGTNTPITVTLLFSLTDAGDNIVDTHVLVDNIRFGTVLVDAKVVGFADAFQDRIAMNVLQASDILSQAGLNVQLKRRLALPSAPDDVIDIQSTLGPRCVDGRVNFRLTADERQLMGLERSETTTDLNVYYVNSLVAGGNEAALGIAIGPDDFCVDVNILTNSGVIMSNPYKDPNALAHEMGHIFISPETAGSALEHEADVNNIMNKTFRGTVLTRAQSASINRARIAGPSLIVP